MTNHLASVLTLSLGEIQNHLAYLNQQGIGRVNRDGNGFLKIPQDPTAYDIAIQHLVDEFGQRINSVEHHIGWAKRQYEYDISHNIDRPEFTEANLVQARISLLQAQVLADQIRNLTYTRP